MESTWCFSLWNHSWIPTGWNSTNTTSWPWSRLAPTFSGSWRRRNSKRRQEWWKRDASKWPCWPNDDPQTQIHGWGLGNLRQEGLWWYLSDFSTMWDPSWKSSGTSYDHQRKRVQQLCSYPEPPQSKSSSHRCGEYDNNLCPVRKDEPRTSKRILYLWGDSFGTLWSLCTNLLWAETSLWWQWHLCIPHHPWDQPQRSLHYFGRGNDQTWWLWHKERSSKMPISILWLLFSWWSCNQKLQIPLQHRRDLQKDFEDWQRHLTSPHGWRLCWKTPTQQPTGWRKRWSTTSLWKIWSSSRKRTIHCGSLWTHHSDWGHPLLQEPSLRNSKTLCSPHWSWTTYDYFASSRMVPLHSHELFGDDAILRARCQVASFSIWYCTRAPHIHLTVCIFVSFCTSILSNFVASNWYWLKNCGSAGPMFSFPRLFSYVNVCLPKNVALH